MKNRKNKRVAAASDAGAHANSALAKEVPYDKAALSALRKEFRKGLDAVVRAQYDNRRLEKAAARRAISDAWQAALRARVQAAKIYRGEVEE